MGKENLVSLIFYLFLLDIKFTMLRAEALLKAIAEKLIPGLPENLRILLVSQVDDENDGFMLAGEDEETQHDPNPELTVTERVVKSDRRRERAMAEQQRLLILMGRNFT